MQSECSDANLLDAFIPFALILQMRMDDFGLCVNLFPMGRLGAGDVSFDCVNFVLVRDLTLLATDVPVIVDLRDYWDYLDPGVR